MVLDMVDQKLLNRHVLFFDADVLNLYRHHSHLYKVTFDYFIGTLSSIYSDSEYDDYLNRPHLAEVSFGCRTKTDGGVAIAVLKYNFFNLPVEYQRKWVAHGLEANSLAPLPDRRFQMWYDSMLNGDWDIGNPPLMRLAIAVYEANKMAGRCLGKNLFKADLDNDLHFPISENSAAYDSAHAKLYIYLVDGLQKEGLKRLAIKANVAVENENLKTLKAVKAILTEKQEHDLWCKIESSLRPVQEGRRRSAHEAGATAVAFPAFETFVHDLEPIIESLSAWTKWIAEVCGDSGAILLEKH